MAGYRVGAIVATSPVLDRSSGKQGEAAAIAPTRAVGPRACRVHHESASALIAQHFAFIAHSCPDVQV